MSVKKFLWISLILTALVAAGCASTGGALPTNTVAATTTAAPSDTVVPTATQTPQPTSAVVIPPGWQVYQGAGFSFAYPPDAQLVDTDRPDAFPRVEFTVTPGTNLIEKYLQVSVSPPVAGECTSPQTQGAAPGTYPAEKVVINGFTFLKESGAQPAAGNIYDFTSYTTNQAGRCVSLTFVLHSGNLGNYATPPAQFDKAAESQIFDQVAATFQFLSDGG
jgi:hypothetical protein